jgi:hypothetical protein
MPLEVMRRLAGDRASDTLRRRILHGGTGRLFVALLLYSSSQIFFFCALLVFYSCFTPLDIDDSLRALGVRVTALVQRGACECSDACRFCQLSASSLALPLDSLVLELRQNIHVLRRSLCILYSSTRPPPRPPRCSPLLLLYICVCAIYEYIYYLYIFMHIYILLHIDADIYIYYSYFSPALLIVCLIYIQYVYFCVCRFGVLLVEREPERRSELCH